MTEQEHRPSSLTNPHDRFFRHFLADPQRAQAFICHVLPTPLLAHLNLERPWRLQREEASFVDPELGVPLQVDHHLKTHPIRGIEEHHSLQ